MKKLTFLLIFLTPFVFFAQENNSSATDSVFSPTKEMYKKGIDTTKYIPKGLQVGTEAPRILATNVNDEKVDSKKILKKKEIVVIFYRGKWCPVCNRYLNNLSDSLSFITDKDAEVLVIGPETFENAEKMEEKTKAKFQMIPDTNLKILTDYDVLFNVTSKYQGKIKTFLMADIAKNNNQEEAILPVPATYIIGKDGKIKYRHFNYDYAVRASVKEILENLK